MRKIMYIIPFIILLFVFCSLNINASEFNIIVEGSKIRKDDKIALQFVGKASFDENYKYGFEFNNGTIVYSTRQENDGRFYASITNISSDKYEDEYTCKAFREKDSLKEYSLEYTSSVMMVAEKLGRGYNVNIDKVISAKKSPIKAFVTFITNGGRFDDMTENKTLELTDACAFPLVTKEGYAFAGWKNVNDGKIYQSFPGAKVDNEKIKYVAIWDEIKDASKLIEQYLDQYKLINEGIIEVITTYDSKPLEWSVETNNFISYSDGIFTFNSDKVDHYEHEIKVTLKYDSNTAYKTITADSIKLKDLSNKSPFAIYFAIGSLGNFTSSHSIENLFSDKLKQELDIVYYSFAYPTEDGGVSLSKSGSYNQVHPKLMELRENGTRIMLSIAGTSSQHCAYFNTICEDTNTRRKFVKNLVDLIEKEGFDGIDIDWESASSENCVVATRLNNLMKDLRAEMDSRVGNGTKYLLTCAIPSTSWGAKTDRFDFATLDRYVDYVNMMSYDLNNEDVSTHVSPLYTSSNDKGYYFSADYGVTLFTKNGLSKNKIIIGTAAYGKSYKVTSTSVNTKYPGLGLAAQLCQISGVTGSHASGTIYYNGVLQLFNNSKYKKYIEYNDSKKLVGTYLYNEEDKIFVAYEGEEIIKAKAEYAKANGLGIMIWSYCEDGSGNLCEVIANNIR